MPAKGVQRAHLCRIDGGVFISDFEARSGPTLAQGARSPEPFPTSHSACAVVVADGDVPDRATLDAAWPGWLERDAFVIAADGGWHKALGLGLRPSLLVGDADSLPEATFAEARAAGVETQRVEAAKDESDTELAVQAALSRGARHVTILGALGGRLDHTLANVGLLALPDPAAAGIELLDGRTRVRLLRSADGGADTEPDTPPGAAFTCALTGPVGDIVSLFPLGATAAGVTTRGLLYPLRDEPLPPGPARGLSNVRTSADAAVSLRQGQLLVVEVKADSERDPASTDIEPIQEGDRP